MKKRKRIILGVLFIAFVFAAFIGVRSAYNAFHSSETAEVNRTETIAPTTTGEECTNTDAMSSYYGVSVAPDANNSQVISTNHGSFRVVGVSAVDDDGNSVDYHNMITVEPTELGNLTSDNSFTIPITDGADGTVTINFVLAESDEKCLSYDAATPNSDGEKVGTYEMSVELTLNPIKDQREQVENTNYDGICAVFRTGQGYSNYADIFGNKVSEELIQKYNYNAVSETQKETYNNIMSYCLNKWVDFDYTDEQVVSLIASAIRIVKKTGSSSESTPVTPEFSAAFNDAKSKAEALGHVYTATDGRVNRSFDLACDWDLQQEEGGDYYVNKDYYYASETVYEDVFYEYNYTSSDSPVREPAGSCNRTCEEAVVVEYGAPVASKAGLCFEYKVRVTSRVVCSSKFNVSMPEKKSICTPTPFCNYIPGRTHQGGPNDTFDTCIMNCDGGEYSDSCSQKCYDEVYGDDEASYDPLAIRYGDAAVEEMASSFPGYDGSYYWSGNSIYWKSSRSYATYGRWYQENESGRTSREHDYYHVGGIGKYLPDYKGFKRQNFRGNQLCADPCYWTGCSKNSYMNDEEAARDYIENLNRYYSAKNTCEGGASCTTKTGTFTIGVDYINGEGNTVTVDFPLSSSGVDNATLESHGEGSSGSTSGTEIFIPELTIDTDNEDGYSGCYNSSDAQNWYEAAWSFPGTYINNKTGEIQFSTPQNSGAWHYQKDKFCMPLDAQSTNVKWWEWKEVNDTCYTRNEIEDSINYNIHASTSDFGYFGWEFNIKCFYGLKNETTSLDENGCPTTDGGGDSCTPGDPDCDTTSVRDYTFRIVDLNNLFPEGSTTTDSNKSNIVIGGTTTGRQPGYNWTLGTTTIDESNNLSDFLKDNKNSGYIINPLALINTIQERGNSIYGNDKYLDYEIELSTEILRKIREYNAEMDGYTDYGGDTTKNNGVTSYVSDLLTELGSSVVLERGTPGVNNEGEGA